MLEIQLDFSPDLSRLHGDVIWYIGTTGKSGGVGMRLAGILIEKIFNRDRKIPVFDDVYSS